MKKRIATLSLVMALMVISAIPVCAMTVYYNGTPVSWDYGRKAGVISYSTVMSSVYEHSATANTTFSGWQKPGVEAHAEQFVGTGQATAYWNCR